MIQLSDRQTAQPDTFDAYAIIGTDVSFNVLPFGGDISNNRPHDLGAPNRLNRSTWVKFKPNWNEIYPGRQPVADDQYGYIPFYWCVELQ